jgi:hypothetical protein
LVDRRIRTHEHTGAERARTERGRNGTAREPRVHGSDGPARRPRRDRLRRAIPGLGRQQLHDRG